MTPRQRAYALAAERGVTFGQRKDRRGLWQVALWGADGYCFADVWRDGLMDLSRDERLSKITSLSEEGWTEPTAHLWRRVCAVLEAMPKGGESNE